MVYVPNYLHTANNGIISRDQKKKKNLNQTTPIIMHSNYMLREEGFQQPDETKEYYTATKLYTYTTR